MSPPLLVVGCGGLVGRQVVERFRAEGRPVETASHRAAAEPDHLLDLRSGDLSGMTSYAAPKGARAYALICSAVSDIDECRRSFEAVQRFNITHTLKLIALLRARGATPVFCSSDAVFAGERGGYREDDVRRPMMIYGRQKKLIEDALIDSGEPFLILRFGKLVECAPEDASPLGGLIRALGRGEKVKAAHDQRLSLTDATDVARALALLLDAGESGVWHIANPRSVTRLEMAEAVARHVGASGLVEPVSIDSFDFLEPRPKNPVLNSDRFRERFGFEFRDPLEELALITGAS